MTHIERRKRDLFQVTVGRVDVLLGGYNISNDVSKFTDDIKAGRFIK